MPGSVGVVDGDGQIPYKPAAAAIKQENADRWIDRDPELKCHLPGIPRAMYLPYPFQIVQSTNKIQMAYAFAVAARTIHLDTVDPPPADTAMGHSVGRWEGDTLVVDVTGFHGNWLDRAGDFHSEPNAQLIEYNCVEFVEEFVYGHARRQPLVKHWEGETIIVDITRRIPPVSTS